MEKKITAIDEFLNFFNIQYQDYNAPLNFYDGFDNLFENFCGAVSNEILLMNDDAKSNYLNYGKDLLEKQILLYPNSKREVNEILENFNTNYEDVLYDWESDLSKILSLEPAKLIANPNKELYSNIRSVFYKFWYNYYLSKALQWIKSIENSIPIASDIDKTKPFSLNQKILAMRYLENHNYFNLMKFHQDQTKQAALLSLIMNQSQNTIREALGKNIDDLKTEKNLRVLQTFFNPLKNDFPTILNEIEIDIKSKR